VEKLKLERKVEWKQIKIFEKTYCSR
jgi:hypothetical protein